MYQVLAISILFMFSASVIGQKKSNSFFRDKTKLKNPFSLRDPFKAPFAAKARTKKEKFEDEGVFSNIPSIEGIELNKIKITGVFLGKNRRAIAKINDKDTVILTEGMTLGKDKAELKAILPGGIVLVEKIVNVYGQEEYLETIIPIADD